MKKIEELRVIDLRNELEKRGLDKSGVKAVLVKRLKDAMMEDNLYSNLLEKGNDINSNEQQNVDRSMEEQDSLNSDKECMHSEETLVCSDETDCVSPTKNDSSTSNCIYQGPMVTDNEKATSDAHQPVNVADFDEKEKESQEEEMDGYTALGGTEEPEEQSQDTEHEDQELQQDFKEDYLVDTENTEEEKTEASVGPISELVSIGEEEEQLLDEDNSSTNQGLLEDESLNILFEDEDKILDYEENERMEMDEPVLHSEAKAEGEQVDAKYSSSLEKEELLSKEGSKYSNVNGSKSTTAEHIDKKPSEINEKPVGNRNVWVSGLASNTRAQDLKMLFCKHGKVISVKIVANSKSSSAKCFGFVTMNNAEEVDECIRHLHRTELHGRLIQVEKAKGEPRASKVSLKGDARSSSNASNASCVSRRKASSERRGSPGLNRPRKHSPIVIGGYKSRSPRDRARSFSRDRGPRPIKGSLGSDRPVARNGRNRFSPRKSGSVLNFNRIKEERERERSRMRERMIRDKERMRFREEEKLRILERKQKEEAYRLKRERDLLRIEREKMEREKEKLLRLEREQHRVERERLERERDEMQRMKHRSRPPRRSPSPPHPRASGRSFHDRRKGPPLDPPSSSRDYREMPRRRSPPLAPVRRGFQEQGRSVRAKRSPVPPPPPPSLRGIGYDRGRSSDLKRSPPPPSRNDRVFHRRSDGYSSSSNRNRSPPLHPPPPPNPSKSSSFQSSYPPRNPSPHRSNSSHYDGGKTNSPSSGMWRSGSEAISGSNNSRPPPPPSQSNSWRSDGGRWVSGSVGVPIRTSSYNVDNEPLAIPFPAPGFGTGSLTHQHRYDSMNHYKS